MKKVIKKVKKTKKALLPFAIGVIVILLPIAYFSLRSPANQVEAAWFNDNWTYRKKITISKTTAAQTNVYIAFDSTDVLDTSDTNKFQADCGDIRFIKENGQLLPYYINSGCGTSSTDIDVYFDSVVLGNNNIYMYYGNTSADDGFENSAFSTEATNYTIGTPATEEKSPGPAGYWAFDEGTDNTCSGGANDTCDTTNNSNDGAFVASAAWQPEDMCVIGKCLLFDGSDDEISISNASQIDQDTGLGTGVTYEAWIRVLSDGENDEGRVFQNGGASLIQIQSEGTDGYADILFQLDLGVDASVTLTNGIKLDEWHHVAMTYTDDGDDEITVYINGINKGSSTNGSGSPDSSTGGLTIGGMNSSISRNFHGFIDEFKIFNYERSEDEIKTDATKSGTSKGTSVSFGQENNSLLSNGLVGYWKLNEASGGTGAISRIDYSGNNNTLTDNNNVASGHGAYGNTANFVAASSEYLSITDNTKLSGADVDITLTAWVNMDLKTSDRSIVGKYRTTAGNREYLLYYDSGTDMFAFDVSNTGSSSTTVTASNLGSPATGTWYFVVGQHDSNSDTINISVNAGNINTASHTGGINNGSGEFNIGANQAGGASHENYFDGNIQQVRLYKRLLSPGEIEQLYNWTPQPLAYYPFDEKTGTTSIHDKSGNSYTGSINGTMTEANWVRGKFGSALNFDGSDDNIQITHSSSLNASSFTVSAWIYPTGRDSQYRTIVGKGEFPGQTATDYYLQLDTSNHVEGGFKNSQWRYATSTGTVSLNEWTHIAVTFDNELNTITNYINGVLDGTTTTTENPPSSSNDLYIGTDDSSADEFQGYIDEVKIYSYARTPSQIIEDLNGGHPIGGSPIGSQVAYWGFDEMYGDTANDQLGYQNGNLGESATCPGASGCPSWTTSGKVNGALDFNGSDSYVYLCNYPYTGCEALNATDRFSITAWIKSDKASGENLSVMHLGNDLGQDQYQFHINSSGYITLILGSSPTVTGTTNLNSSGATWYHVAATWDKDVDGGAAKVYVNGILEGEGTRTTSITDSWQPVEIGRAASWSTFDGMIDEVKFYSTALTEEQVKIDMNAGNQASFGVLGNTEASTVVDGAGNPPIAYWDFNENTGTATAYDKSGNGNNGTMNGSMTESDWVRGAKGNGSALDFDGGGAADDYINVGSPAILDNLHDDAFTVEAWIKAAGWGEHGSSGGTIVRKSSSDSAGWRLTLRETTPSGLFGQVNAATTNAYSASGTDEFSIDGNWHHVAMTWDDAGDRKVHLWIDGKEVASYVSQVTASGAVDPDASDNLQIGGWGGVYTFDGNIDEVKIYDYARTSAQISYNYNRGAPVGWWQFDECQGTVAYDASGNENNGTITIGASGTNTSAGTCSSGTSTEAWNNGTTGKFNGSLDFDGTDDYITIGDNDTLGSGDRDWSLSAWINVDDVATSQHIVSKSASGTDKEFELGICDDSINPCNVSVDIENNGNNNEVNTSVGHITANTWHHIVATFDASTLTVTIYVDGISRATSGSITQLPDIFTADFVIGRRNYIASNYFNGQIDDVRLYSYILSNDQVLNIMNEKASARFGPSTGSP